MKKIIVLFLITILSMPGLIDAYTMQDPNETPQVPMTEEEVISKLNELPVTVENGVEYMDVPSVDPDLFLEDGRCEFDRKTIIEGDPDYYNSLSPEDLEIAVNEEIELNEKICAEQVYYSTLLFYFKQKNMDFHNLGYGTLFIDKNNIKFNYTDPVSDITKEKIVKLRYQIEYDEDILKEAKKIEKELKKDYNIYGLSMLNSLYHYGDINENIYNNDLVLYRFDDLKETIEKYDDFQIIPRLHGAGSTPLLTGNVGNLGIFKDGIMYAMKETHFGMNHIIYVPEEQEGTLFEKAEKLVSEYFKNEIEVKVKKDSDEIIKNDIWVDGQINKYLGIESGTYEGVLTTINIGDKKSMLFIVEVPEKYLEDTSIKSNHNKTGININTNSYHVPIDVVLEVNNVNDKDYVKKFNEDYKFDLGKVYDINLMKITDRTFVKKIPDGVEVYIPISDKKENDKVKVHHIKEDSTLGETLEGKVVVIDGKSYVKFVTNHFSTFALDMSSGETINNPNTYDGIGIYFITFVIGLFAVLFGIKKLNN